MFPGGHAPVRAPVDVGGIVLKVELGLVAGKAVGVPAVLVLRLRLAPGEIVAVVLGLRGADVHVRPQRAAGQAQVDGLHVCRGSARRLGGAYQQADNGCDIGYVNTLATIRIAVGHILHIVL